MAIEASRIRGIYGTDEATIDEKGRILVGKKKRERLGEPFAMALSMSGCLAAYPQERFDTLVEEILEHQGINPGREQYTRLFLGSADDDLKFDGQGRVVVPQKLREMGKLKDKVLLVGCGDRLEIWSKSEYERYEEDPDAYGRTRREAMERAYAKMVGS